MQHSGWDHALKVTGDGMGLVGHAGAVLLRKAADQAGLTAGLSAAITGVPGSHHPQYVDVVYREHAVVETDGVRTAKAMGLRNLPSNTWQVNKGWVIAANIAADLTAWTRLLGFHDRQDLKEAEPDTLRYRTDLECQPGLAGSRRAGQREEADARPFQQGGDLGQFPLAADEPGDGYPQVRGRGEPRRSSAVLAGPAQARQPAGSPSAAAAPSAGRVPAG